MLKNLIIHIRKQWQAYAGIKIILCFWKSTRVIIIFLAIKRLAINWYIVDLTVYSLFAQAKEKFISVYPAIRTEPDGIEMKTGISSRRPGWEDNNLLPLQFGKGLIVSSCNFLSLCLECFQALQLRKTQCALDIRDSTVKTQRMHLVIPGGRRVTRDK